MFCNSCTFHPVKKSAWQPAPAPPQPEQLPNCDANLMLERYTPNHMRFMNVPEDPEPEAQQPDPAPLEPGQVPNDVNPLLTELTICDFWMNKYMTW